MIYEHKQHGCSFIDEHENTKKTHTHTLLFAGHVKCTTHVLSFVRLWYACSLNALLPRAQLLVEKESPWVQISNYSQGFLPAQQLHIQHISLQLTTVTKAANYSYSGHRATQEGCSLCCLCKLGSSSYQLALNRPSFTTNCCPSTTDAHLKYGCFSTMKVHRLLLLLFPHCRQYMAYTDQGNRTSCMCF